MRHCLWIFSFLFLFFFGGDPVPDGETPEGEKLTEGAADDSSAKMEEDEEDDEEEESLPGCTLFIKNLNFDTTEETLKAVSVGSGVRVGTPARSRQHGARSADPWRASWQCVASHLSTATAVRSAPLPEPRVSGSRSSQGLGRAATHAQGTRRDVSGGGLHPTKATVRVCAVCLETKPLAASAPFQVFSRAGVVKSCSVSRKKNKAGNSPEISVGTPWFPRKRWLRAGVG